jgi:uncharacterized membrane protein
MIFGIMFIIMGIVCLIVSNAKEESIGYFGYKSSASVENKENWKFSNIVAGILMIIAGAILVFIEVKYDLSLVVNLVLFLVATLISMILVEVSIIFYERRNKNE